jgi:guanylate kinase
LLPRAHFTITATTRRPRKDERHGVDYYFVSPDQFKQMVESGEMLEHALVYGDHKGVPKEPIREALAAGRRPHEDKCRARVTSVVPER